MEDQIPSSTPPASYAPTPNVPLGNGITPEMLEALKARAREMAVQQVMARPTEPEMDRPMLQAPVQQPQVIYVRRNLTVAELILVFALSCGLVAGLQGAWNFVSNIAPRIEIKMK